MPGSAGIYSGLIERGVRRSQHPVRLRDVTGGEVAAHLVVRNSIYGATPKGRSVGANPAVHDVVGPGLTSRLI